MGEAAREKNENTHISSESMKRGKLGRRKNNMSKMQFAKAREKENHFSSVVWISRLTLTISFQLHTARRFQF